MYVLLGDPGYPGPPGLRGESGQKGNRNTKSDVSLCYECYSYDYNKNNLLIIIRMMPECACFKL